MQGEAYTESEEIVYDYITVENGKVVGGNEKLLESGIIAIGNPEAEEKSAEVLTDTESCAESTDEVFEASVETQEADDAVTESLVAESSVAEESALTKKIDAKSTVSVTSKATDVPELAPNAVNPNAPTEVVKATHNVRTVYNQSSSIATTWSTIYPNAGTSTYRQIAAQGTVASTTVNWDASSVLYTMIPVQIFEGHSLTLQITASGSEVRGIAKPTNSSHSAYYTSALICVYGGNLTIKGYSSGTDANRFTLDGQKANHTYGSDSDPLIVLLSGTVTLENVRLINNSCGMNHDGKTTGFGSAIAMDGGTLSINNAWIHANTFNSGTYKWGAIGIKGGTASLTNCNIYNNTNATHGGGIYVSGGNVTYNSGEIYSNSSGTDGGGICCYGGTVNVKGGTIRDNSANQGGGMYVKGPGTIKMSGGTVTSNDNGSGVFLYDGGNFELSGGEISSNTAGGHHGGGVAIYDNKNGKFTMSGGTIKSHSGSGNSHGVAQTIGSGGGGTIEIKGGTIESNTTSDNVGGGVFLNCGTFTMTNGTIKNNTAKWGGGILAKGNAASVTISGGTISSNTASINGGGVMVESGTLSISGGTISGNTSQGVSTGDGNTGRGGGVCVTVTCTISGSALIKGNTSKDQGGGVYSIGGKLTISGGQIGAEGEANYSANGGGVYAGATAALEISGSAKILHNRCKTSGAGVFVAGEQVTFTMSGGDISHNYNEEGNGGGFWVGNLKSCSITGGIVNHNTTYVGCGAGMFFNRPVTGGVSISGLSLEENTANHAGGGLYFGNYGGSLTATVTNTTLKNNHAVASATTSVPTAGSGGGVAVRVESGASGNVTVTFTDCIINGNTAREKGGGIYIVNQNTAGSKPIVTINGTTKIGESDATKNTAQTGGGGVYVHNISGNNGTITFKMEGSVSVKHNTSVESGGGVFLASVTGAVINGADIVGNKTTGTAGSGGGIAMYKATLTMEGTTVSGNAAGFNGGGVTANQSSLTATDCIFGDEVNGGNTCVHRGGGVYVENGTLSITGGSVTGNSATNTTDIPSYGGGIATYSSNSVACTVTLENVTITKNHADDDGGGVAKSDVGTTTVINCDIGAEEAGNTSRVGAGFACSHGSVTISGSRICYNVSDTYAGGFYAYGNSTNVDIKNSNIDHNDAKQGDGGGVFIAQVNKFKLTGGTASNNTAICGGGMFFKAQTGQKIEISGCTLAENIASGSGGGIMFTNQEAFTAGTTNSTITAELTSLTFTHNVTSGNGGGICITESSYCEGGINITVSGCSFAGNEALRETPIMTTDSNGKYNRVTISTTGNGGAISIEGVNAVATISNSQIGSSAEGGYSNKAINGGGIAVMRGATATVTNSDFVYNSALRTGGGCYVLGCGENEPNFTTTLNLTGGTVENNYAQGSSKYEGDDVINTAMAAAASEMGGGGLYIRGCSPYGNKKITVDIDGTAINNNTSCRGGGLLVHESVNVTFKNASFAKNNATYLGGAMCFMKNSSTAKFSGCTFTENEASLRGGAFYIQTNGVTVENCAFTGNTAVNNGGAIQLQSATNTNIDLKVSNTDFTGNSANYGGALCTVQSNNSYAFTVTLTDCDFTGNHATANGGAILVGNKVTLNFTGGYLTGNTAGEDQSGIDPVSNSQGVAVTKIAGAGGAVAVFDGTFNFTVNNTNKGAIHSNTAATVGDDVFSNGSANSKLNLPAVGAMDLTGFTYEVDKTPDWFEDYAEGEASGMNANISYSERYRFSDNTIHAQLENINTQSKYVAITVGVSINFGELVITKSGDSIDPDQVFVFKVSGYSERSGKTIEFTVSIKGTGSVKIVDLPVGEYTVTELTSWAWRYGETTIKVDGSAITFTAAEADITVNPDHIDHTVEFISALQNPNWLSFNTDPVKNIPANNTVAYIEAVYDLPKKNII